MGRGVPLQAEVADESVDVLFELLNHGFRTLIFATEAQRAQRVLRFYHLNIESPF
jgi:hypothetical protein